MANYLLDIMIEETQFSGCIRNRPGPVWLLIRADGVSQQIVTNQVSPNTTALFKFPARLVLNLPSLEGSYLKTSLCAYADDGAQAVILASAQIRLTNLPTGKPQRFTFPLLMAGSTNVEAAIVGASALISPINLQGTGGVRATYAGAYPQPPKKRLREGEQTYSGSIPQPLHRFPPPQQMQAHAPASVQGWPVSYPKL